MTNKASGAVQTLTMRVVQHLEGPKAADIMARFLAKTDQRGKCWLWTAATGSGGYGCFKVARGVSATAHRFSLIAATMRDPIGLEACHSCHNPLCCNPAHLRWGTRAENEADKGKKFAQATVLKTVPENTPYPPKSARTAEICRVAHRVRHPFAWNIQAQMTAQEAGRG